MAVSAADIAPKAFEQLVKQGGDHQDVEDDLQVHPWFSFFSSQLGLLFACGSRKCTVWVGAFVVCVDSPWEFPLQPKSHLSNTLAIWIHFHAAWVATTSSVKAIVGTALTAVDECCLG